MRKIGGPHAGCTAGSRRRPSDFPRFLVFTVLVPALAAGCLHLELRIRLDADGTATATERLRFSEQLLDMSATAPPQRRLAPLLTREAALERLARMGPGVTLASHELKDIEGGAKESVAVYQIQDLNEFRYVSPFLAYTDYPENAIVKVNYVPLYKSRPYNGTAGEMAISFRPLKPPKSEPRYDEKNPPPKGPTPAELQALRDVEPLFRDMLKGFQVRMTFESYCAIRSTGFGFRGHKDRVNFVDMINFSDQDLDRYGGKFIDNEEIMLDLIRWQMGSRDITETVYEFTNNPSVPIFLPFGSRHQRWRQSDEIYIPPSRAIFKQYFEGQELDFSRWGPGPKVPATWERIGWKDEDRAGAGNN